MNLYNIEAEQAVIGGLCIDGQLIDDVAGVVKASDFYVGQYRQIFATIQGMAEAGQNPEIISVSDALEKRFPSDDWLPTLAVMAKNTPGTANIKIYAQKVAEYARLRDLFMAGHKVQEIAKDAEMSLQERIASAQDALIALETDGEEKGPRMLGSMARGFVDQLDQCYRSKGGITGLSTGFDCIDQRTGGLKPGQLITIAARPAMGKTNFAFNVARNVGIRQAKTVLYFSLEMSSDELMGRLTADLANVDYGRVQRADFDESERHTEAWARVTAAITRFKDGKIGIDDDSSMSIGQLVSRARKFARTNKDLALIVVDHIGLVDSEGETETIRVGRVSRALKKLAKQLAVPVLALSQLNRECEKRNNRRPMLSDLRSSGDIEQDSDIVGFVYRDVVYNEKTQWPEVAEIIWRKVRAGQIGTDIFRSEFAFCRFEEMEKPPGYGEAEDKPMKSRYDDL